jgi:hypothetical protein
MNWYKKAQTPQQTTEGIQVFHGSDLPDLANLRANKPNYAYGGDLGGGVYVGTEMFTAEYYGRYVYELRTKFGWESVLQIGGEEGNYEPIEDMQNSLSIGESIQPFMFRCKDKLYAVTGLQNGSDGALLTVEFNKNFKEAIQDCSLDPIAKNAISKIIDYAERNERMFDDSQDYVEALWDNEEELVATGKIKANMNESERDALETQFKTFVDQIINEVKSEIEKTKPIEISLDEIGEVAKGAGYKAVHADGIRQRATVNEELLVFDQNDLVMVRQVK